MKRLSRRTWMTLALALLLLAGLVLYLVRFALNSERWVVFPGNPHAYSGTHLLAGEVTDRDGEKLLDFSDGKSYSADSTVRKATLHLLGDRTGNVPSPVLDRYAARLLGYDVVSGLYGAQSRRGALKLTISARVQTEALNALAGRSGTVLVYNYQTGEILCAASSPTFDPDGSAPAESDGVYLNRAFGAVYTPGSIFKLVTAAAAIETLPDAQTATYRCEGTYAIGEQSVTCTAAHGDLTLEQALAKSCNCAFAQIAGQLGKKAMLDSVKRWGVVDACRFDGIITPSGRFDPQDADQIDFAWACIGQYTDLVNPCSYLRFVGMIAGEGKAAQPYLTAQAGGYTAHTKNAPYRMEAETARILADYMAYAAETVYGNIADLPVCAKSGTAEVGEGQPTNANFVGFVRSEACPLAFYITVEGGGSGSKTCAPIADRVLRACKQTIES